MLLNTPLFYNHFVKPLLKLYLKRDTRTTIDEFKLTVHKGVFHPGLFFSTKYFYEFLKSLDFKGLSLLEIGSGSGLLSLLAYKKGARVTAIDIDPKAVVNTKYNFENNFQDLQNLKILESDLFEKLSPEKFDVIIVNPPYFFKEVTSPANYAWYCGVQGEYFEKIFRNLRHYTHKNSQVYMILSENCEIERIKNIAKKHNVTFKLADQRKIKWEQNYIFLLNPFAN